MKNNNIKRIVLIAIFSSISAVLMLIDFPIPFAPSFMKIDFAEVSVMIASFVLSPFYGILIVFLKILLKLMIKGSSTVFIGEIANFISSVCYVFPCSLIYYKNKNKSRAIVGLIIGTIISSVVSVLLNAFLLFPMYMKMFSLDEAKILSMIKAVNPFVTNLQTAYIYSILPFNLFKYLMVSTIVFFVYMNISNFIKKI